MDSSVCIVSSNENSDFVTVVSVGTGDQPKPPNLEDTPGDAASGYVTVLKIGDEDAEDAPSVVEEVLVYRLPGERLGFGLKFEGGIRAKELVKRLFIQSCAQDSPASRATSSWGHLVEGDEILEIDSVSVTSLSRIDCVRRLKDSNLVIKLLIKHTTHKVVDKKDARAKSIEDLPLVVSAEAKRPPPPPPPVPPRKIPRKLLKSGQATSRTSSDNVDGEAPAPVSRQTQNETPVNGFKNRQSPRNSTRSLQPRDSPEVVKRDRKLSNSGLEPPEAEVYVDLISQESTYSLSESDDTGSSISTVIDRIGSSVAGSLPSTPTAIQKHLDFMNHFDKDDGDFIDNKNYLYPVHRQGDDLEEIYCEKSSHKDKLTENTPLQPPVSFQDAALSYGNEDVRTVEAAIKTALAATDSNGVDSNGNYLESDIKIPLAKPNSQENNVEEEDEFDEDRPGLPRLVDFVPKSKNEANGEESNHDKSISMVKLFLENEKRLSYNDFIPYKEDSYENGSDSSSEDLKNWGNSEFYTWNSSTQLATIGEDEEEGLHDYSLRAPVKPSTPIVIVEHADGVETKDNKPILEETNRGDAVDGDKDNTDMEYILLNSRQPPDGHEFPDGNEFSEPTERVPPKPATLPPDASIKFEQRMRNIWERNKDQQSSASVKDKIAKFSNSSNQNNFGKHSKSYEDIFEASESDQKRSSSKSRDLYKSTMSFNDMKCTPLNTTNLLTPSSKTKSSSDLSFESDVPHKRLEGAKLDVPPRTNLHTRSQSLVDVSCTEPNKMDRWAAIIEQRKSKLSKLKGLVIPEAPETVESPIINLPEIKTSIPSLQITSPIETRCHNQESVPPTTTQNFQSRISTFYKQDNQSLPKYSPAFKRKSLQIYGDAKSDLPYAPKPKSIIAQNDCDKDTKTVDNYLSSNDSKSLESITSPTRSDSSFEYINNFGSSKPSEKPDIPFEGKDIQKSEDESDNDSAVSSSQSSYVSRTSPPPSPNSTPPFFSQDRKGSENEILNPRVLKPQSVEAINRKNILASAKCRSGQDFKGPQLIDSIANEEAPPETKPLKETPEEIKPIKPEAPTQKPVVEPIIQHQTEPIISKVEPKKIEEKVTKMEASKSTSQSKIFESKEKSDSPLSVIRKSSTETFISKRLSTISNSTSVTDLRKNFEKFTDPVAPRRSDILPSSAFANKRVNRLSLNLSKSTEMLTSKASPKVEEKFVADMSEEEKEQIITGVLDHFSTEKLAKDNIKVVTLRPEISGGSVGLTLAGGSDCETRDIIVHKVRAGSPAFSNGNLEKGDRILSINGKYMKNVTHTQSVAILKEPFGTVVLVIYKEKGTVAPKTPTKLGKSEDVKPTINTTKESSGKFEEVILQKDAAGLGFSVEGGYDSPLGNLPLLVKRIFKGCAADKSGKLHVGDEIVEINSTDVSKMSRMDAWLLMKKLQDGDVIIKVRR